MQRQIVDNKAKGRISKRVFQESKARQNFRKTNIYLLIRKKCLFFGNFGVLCFLETPVLRFALFPYSRRYQTVKQFGKFTKISTIYGSVFYMKLKIEIGSSNGFSAILQN